MTRAELRAVRDRVTDVGIPAFIGKVGESQQFPFASLSAPGHGVQTERAMCGGASAEFDVRVMVTDNSEESVYPGLDTIRADLSPGGAETRLDVDDRHVTVRWVRSEFVTWDPDFIYAGTNRPAAYGVDTYRVVSQPIPTDEGS